MIRIAILKTNLEQFFCWNFSCQPEITRHSYIFGGHSKDSCESGSNIL
jgi:hypothetical protein